MVIRILSSLGAAAALALVVACSSSQPASPASPSTQTTTASALDQYVGTWHSSASGSPVALPNGCSQLDYQVAKNPDGQSATVTFSATCATVAGKGTGNGTLAGTTLRWGADGTVSFNGQAACPFHFQDSTATPEGTNAIRINYTGTVCGVPVSGSEVVTK
jgi:hypothetical protein